MIKDEAVGHRNGYLQELEKAAWMINNEAKNDSGYDHDDVRAGYLVVSAQD